MNDTTTNGLTQHWVEVADASGRTHLEAHWIGAALLPTHQSTSAA